MLNKILTYLRGKPNSFHRHLKEAFYNELDGGHYEYFQYVMDCYVLEQCFRYPFFRFHALNGRAMSLNEGLDFVKNKIIPDIYALQCRYNELYELLITQRIIEKNDRIQSFNEYWGDLRDKKYRAFKFLEALFEGNIVTSHYHISNLLEEFEISFENSCHIGEQYFRYLLIKTEEFEELNVYKTCKQQENVV